MTTPGNKHPSPSELLGSLASSYDPLPWSVGFDGWTSRRNLERAGQLVLPFTRTVEASFNRKPRDPWDLRAEADARDQRIKDQCDDVWLSELRSEGGL